MKKTLGLVAAIAIGIGGVVGVPAAAQASPFTTSAKPIIAGTPKVGQTLTGSGPETWTPKPTGVKWTWLRGNTVAQTGFDNAGTTYTLTTADLGKKIRVEVEAWDRYGVDHTERSAQTATVTGDLTKTPTPTISGTATAGKTLTASAGAWDAGVTLTYQWLRGGAAINGATSASYKLTSGDVGAVVSVRVTGEKQWHTTVSRVSTATTTVAATPAQPAPTPPPAKNKVKLSSVKITGAKRVGVKLTAKATATTGAKLTYQWYKGSKKISGAIKKSYTVKQSDRGHRLKVQVRATKSGLSTASKSSAKTAKIKKGVLSKSRPKITGTKQVGKTLTAKKSWGVSGVKTKYTWYAGSKKIGSGKKLKIKAKHVGKKISVKVVGKKSGFKKVTRSSSKTAKIKKGKISGGKPTIKGTKKVGSKLTAAVSWAATKKYTWRSNGTKVGSGSTYKVSAADAGKKITVTAVGTKKGYTKKTATSASISIPKAPPNTGSTAPATTKQIEDRIFKLTNAERKKHGLPAFKRLPQVRVKAAAHLTLLSSSGDLYHTTGTYWSNDGQWCDYLGGQGPWTPTENLASGSNKRGIGEADHIVAMWMASPGHRAAMLDPNSVLAEPVFQLSNDNMEKYASLTFC